MKKLALLSTFLGLLALVFLPTVLKNHGIYLFTYWLIYVIAAMGLNLTVGYAGQKSLGHAAFFGIGAYTVAIMLKAGLSFWLGLPMAALGCFIVGLALGFPALRVQTIYLAFATLGFNTALWLVMRNEEWLTGGTFGINNIARPEAFGISFDGNLAYYYLVLGVTLLLAALLLGLLRSPWGKAFTALRDNPIRAESLGIDIRNYTLLSFAIGAAYAGIAGALFGGCCPGSKATIGSFRGIHHTTSRTQGCLGCALQAGCDSASAISRECALCRIKARCAILGPFKASLDCGTKQRITKD